MSTESDSRIPGTGVSVADRRGRIKKAGARLRLFLEWRIGAPASLFGSPAEEDREFISINRCSAAG